MVTLPLMLWVLMQLSVEQYKDQAAIESHKAAPEFQGLAAKAKDWLAEPFIIDLLQPSKL